MSATATTATSSRRRATATPLAALPAVNPTVATSECVDYNAEILFGDVPFFSRKPTRIFRVKGTRAPEATQTHVAVAEMVKGRRCHLQTYAITRRSANAYLRDAMNWRSMTVSGLHSHDAQRILLAAVESAYPDAYSFVVTDLGTVVVMLATADGSKATGYLVFRPQPTNGKQQTN